MTPEIAADTEQRFISLSRQNGVVQDERDAIGGTLIRERGQRMFLVDAGERTVLQYREIASDITN